MSENQYTNAIEIRNLTKRYGSGFTLDNISFDVPKGSVMGFIGQNGAGKTTTLRSLLNIIKADSGAIKLLGLGHIKDEQQIKERISVVFDELPFHDIFNARDMARIFEGIYPKWNNAVYYQYLERFQLSSNKKIGEFSKGMKMKLQIACALSHEAELLVMDEATTGLDPVVRDDILHIFLEYMQEGNRSILMSSHITSDLEKIADRVTFIDRGKLLVSGSKSEILNSHRIYKCARDGYGDIDRDDIVSVRVNGQTSEVLLSDSRKYNGLSTEEASLEDIMLYYVNREKREWS